MMSRLWTAEARPIVIKKVLNTASRSHFRDICSQKVLTNPEMTRIGGPGFF